MWVVDEMRTEVVDFVRAGSEGGSLLEGVQAGTSNSHRIEFDWRSSSHRAGNLRMRKLVWARRRAVRDSEVNQKRQAQ
jgi:hypothetical protein